MLRSEVKRGFAVRNIQLLSIVFIVGLVAATAPGFAQTATPVSPTPPPTATPVTTPPVPTATPTLPPAAVSFDDANLIAGQPVTASGTANDGPYCLAMVQPGVFSIGDSYTATPVSSIDLTVSGGSFSGVTVNNSAPVGQFDLLLLVGPCSTANIITAGDRLDAGSGLDVMAGAAIPAVSKTGGFVVLILIAAAGVCLLWRRV
jgi:hypothetical protein